MHTRPSFGMTRTQATMSLLQRTYSDVHLRPIIFIYILYIYYSVPIQMYIRNQSYLYIFYIFITAYLFRCTFETNHIYIYFIHLLQRTYSDAHLRPMMDQLVYVGCSKIWHTIHEILIGLYGREQLLQKRQVRMIQEKQETVTGTRYKIFFFLCKISWQDILIRQH